MKSFKTDNATDFIVTDSIRGAGSAMKSISYKNKLLCKFSGIISLRTLRLCENPLFPIISDNFPKRDKIWWQPANFAVRKWSVPLPVLNLLSRLREKNTRPCRIKEIQTDFSEKKCWDARIAMCCPEAFIMWGAAWKSAPSAGADGFIADAAAQRSNLRKTNVKLYRLKDNVKPEGKV